jgi:hypothetical protein
MQSPIPYVGRILFPGESGQVVKLITYLHKNEWSYTATPPTCLHSHGFLTPMKEPLLTIQ